MDNKRKLLILYASETGNAQDVAERIAREAIRRHYLPVLVSTQNYEASALPLESSVVFVASTCGQGDAPVTMKNFWRFLLRKNLGQAWLRGVHYAVFGLGDSGYQKYNLVAKKLDRRLSDLGGKQIVSKGLGDDQHRSGYEAALDPWLVAFWTAMRERIPLPSGLADPDPKDGNILLLDRPKFRVAYRDPPTESHMPSLTIADKTGLPSVQDSWIRSQKARVMLDFAAGDAPTPIEHESSGYGPDRPIFAKLVTNERLTAGDHGQNVRHIEFNLGQGDVNYLPGDILTLLPSQSPDAVNNFLKRLSLDGDAYVTVEAAGSDFSCSWSEPQILQLEPVKIRTLVEGALDIDSASPRRYLFEVMSHFATAEHEKERLEYFASSEGRDELYQYNQRERRSVLEVLQDFPSVQLPLEWVLQLVPKLKTRAFSISSSPKVHPNQAHVTLAVVKWITPFKRLRHGLCSSWLSELDPTASEVFVPVWITRGALTLPPPSVPLVLVGPGTGCAPFRAFLEERIAESSSNTVAPVIFFFGCRSEGKDFLYKDFWLSCSQGKGVLSPEVGGGLFVAFSRDQPQKVYVQNKIRENCKVVWDLLQSGAAIFISGSANKMPAQVTSTFEEILVSEAGISRESAMRRLKELERLGRFCIETWS